MMRGSKLLKFFDYSIGIPICFILGCLEKISSRGLNFTCISHPRTILLIKLSALGDTILLVPAIRALRSKLPDTHITFVCTPINKEIIEPCPYIDEIITLEIRKSFFIFFHMLNLISLLRKKRYELSIDFDQWSRISSLISYISGAPERIGFKTPAQYKHYLCTKSAKHNTTAHEVDCFFDLLKIIGIESSDKQLEFWISEGYQRRAEKILSKFKLKAPFTLIFPGVPPHGWQRQWPIENFAELSRIIQKKFGCEILIVGTSGNKDEIEKITRLAGTNSIFILTDVSIKVLSVIIKKSLLVICNNSGIMHLVCAMKTPVVALHGPTDTRKWGPLGERSYVVKSDLPCSPCLYLGFEYKCRTRDCMEAIKISDVLPVVNKVLSSQMKPDSQLEYQKLGEV